MATAVSAAEMAMENKEKKYPSSPPGNRKRLNTAKLMSVAFSISSMLISIASVLRRGEKPQKTAEKKIDGKNKKKFFPFLTIYPSPQRTKVGYLVSAHY